MQFTNQVSLILVIQSNEVDRADGQLLGDVVLEVCTLH